ncbi:MAG: FAD-dependent monooxygenase [Janthinobacterium lividum]
MFDLVLVAEGIGSSTRQLVFGPEVTRRPLNLYTGYFTIPRGETDGSVARWFNAPGGRTVLVRPDRHGTTRALLTLQQEPAGYEDLSPAQQKALLQARFADAGWETPRVLAGLAADDFYFEAIGQVRLDRWAKGRIALTGDAAWCASPISGIGTSLALVGAYVLAGELAGHPDDHAAAFAAYEQRMRPYVAQGQDVSELGTHIASPHSRLGIALQHAALRLASQPGVRQLAGKLLEPPADAIELPKYGHAL